MDRDRKAELKTPVAKQCPFLREANAAHLTRFHSSELRDAFGAAQAEFHGCPSGHIYGAIATNVYPNRRSDNSE